MDFSTQCIVKNESAGETNYSPVPVRFSRELDKTGIRIHVFYEKVKSLPVGTLHSTTEPLRTFPFYCLLQLLDGDGFFYEPKEHSVREFLPGTGLIVSPGVLHRYGGLRKNFTEDSICFSGPAADALCRAGLIRDGLIYMGRERRLLPIIQLLREATLASQFQAIGELISLLIQLRKDGVSSESGENVLHRRIGVLMDEVRASSRFWSVDEMAEYAGMSANQLRKCFHEQTGSSPKVFLDRLWLNRAVELLCNSELSLLEIAGKTGCVDSYYFFRRFKKLSGYTPARYRDIYGAVKKKTKR